MPETVQTVDPASGEPIATYERDTPARVERCIETVTAGFVRWRRSSIADRTELLLRLSSELEEHQNDAAGRITREMGKPISQAEAEITKCVELCRYYAAHAGDLLSDQQVKTEARASYVRFDPLGPILGIMPWNFPYWQVFRWGVPTLLAGNSLLLSHADNVLGAAAHIADLFRRADAPDGVFGLLNVSNEQARHVIEDQRVRGVSLTGSVRAGSAVAGTAAAKIKPTVLELGGSDPCIVLADADLDTHMGAIVNARFQNTGQTCIAAKRYLVDASIASEFRDRLVASVQNLSVGNPGEPTTDIGPLARQDLLATLSDQVDRCRAEGLDVVVGGRQLDRPGYFYSPTVLDGCRPDATPFREELFGPVASICVCRSREEMISWANATDYGLSASIWTADAAGAQTMAADLDVGCVFINQSVKSDMRLPFGGVKNSGYGRELGGFGVREFSNAKTVWVSS